MTIHFYKFQGTGNDFIIIDNYTKQATTLSNHQIKLICDRRFGVGADGLIFLNKVVDYDFEMVYFNANGHHSTMCGNGGRCLVKFAHQKGIHKTQYNFLAMDGVHQAEIENNGEVKLKMIDVLQVQESASHCILNTGSPHYIKFCTDVFEENVYKHGQEIRYSKEFLEEGINVNFVQKLEDDKIFVRTYERGVEDETLSCGTGVTAAALVSAHNDNGFNRVEVKTKGGKLSVEFDKINDHQFKNIWLCGPAEFVFDGTFTLNN